MIVRRIKMSKLLENQVAIVTGSAGGIGREVVEMFVEHGAKW
jgi:3-oxoacyl-[acyl-carrier protein] reductase